MYSSDALVHIDNKALLIFEDADADTMVQTEESADDDTIRFDVAGVQRSIITSTAFEIVEQLKISYGGVLQTFFTMDSSGNFDLDANNGDITIQ